MSITVVNKKKGYPVPTNTIRMYVGRPTALGNPYSHEDGTLAKYKVDSREEAVDMYRIWFAREMASGTGPAYDMVQVIKGFTNVELECWCAPLECHGDVIKEYLEQ